MSARETGGEDEAAEEPSRSGTPVITRTPQSAATFLYQVTIFQAPDDDDDLDDPRNRRKRVAAAAAAQLEEEKRRMDE